MALTVLGDHTPKIDPTAWVHGSAEVIGEVELGAQSSIWPLCVLRGDVGLLKFGAHTNIQDGTIVHATGDISTVVVGDRCTIGHRVILHGCHIGDDCLIGMGAIVLDNVIIGAGSFVAAGSLIPPGKVFEPGSFIVGAPAKCIRAVGDKERMVIDGSWQVYCELIHRHRASGPV